MAAKRKRRNEKKAQNAVHTKKTVETRSAKKAKSPDSAGKTIGMVGPGNRKGGYGPEEPASYGKVASRRTVITDITELKRAEERIRSKEAELSLILDRIPLMFTLCSHDLHYRYVSRGYAQMFGVTPDQFTGKSILNVIGESTFQTIRPHIESVLQGQRVEYEARIHLPPAGNRILNVIYVPEKDKHEKVIGWLALTTDITERKQMEETLRQSNEELDRFNKAMVGRELRIIELKKEVNELCDLNGQKQRYPLKFEKENENEKNETRIT